MQNMFLIAIAIGLIATGCQSAPQSAPSLSSAAQAQPAAVVQPHKLTASELRAMNSVPHTSYAAGNWGPRTYAAYYTPDGQIKGHSPWGSDVGTYRITDDSKFCSKYRTFRNGAETCQDIYQTGPDTYEAHLPDGTIVHSIYAPGNPEGF